MGYYSDQNGINERYSKEAQNWQLHLENTKAFICKSANDKLKNKAAVLGSGWLLDIPVQELSEMFMEVWLFDIRHSAYVYNKIKNLKNVIPVVKDISGFAIPLYLTLKTSGKNNFAQVLDNIKPDFDFSLKDFDFVVSCNLLDQLDAIPLEYILKHHKIESDKEKILRINIQNAHLDILPKSKSCVIADIEEYNLDMHDNLLHSKKLVYPEVPEMHNSETWIWKYDTGSLYKSDYQTWFRVAAFNI